MGGRVEITDTLELNGLRWLDPEMTYGKVKRDRLLLGKSCVEGELTKPG